MIPLETRNHYMACLEEASVRKNIEPFSGFLAGLVKTDYKKSGQMQGDMTWGARMNVAAQQSVVH